MKEEDNSISYNNLMMEEELSEDLSYLSDDDIFFEKETSSELCTPNRRNHKKSPPNVKLNRKNYLKEFRNSF